MTISTPSISSLRLALQRMAGTAAYPSAPPFLPDQAYPEFPHLAISESPNPVFGMVRELFHTLELDAEHFGTPAWNPLGDLVAPGAKIVVKPNWVLHQNMGGHGMDCMITHPSVLRAVLEYAFLARPAQVILGDAPLQGCNWPQLQEWGGLTDVIGSFTERGLPLVVKDFRRTIMQEDGAFKHVSESLKPESDYVLVDLGEKSLLEAISGDWKKFRVTVYDPRKMWKRHSPGRHQYLIARDLLDADLVLNAPKLKVHKKAGITCCLKNLIGINGNKEFLPHHRKGAAGNATGDNYARPLWQMTTAETVLDMANCLRGFPRIYRFMERVVWWLMKLARQKDPAVQLEGGWYGNDTIWRTCLDLNRVLLYAGVDGQFRDQPQRHVLSIADAIVTGQGDGPLSPEPLQTGALFATLNSAVGDVLGAELLGLDVKKIPLTRHAMDAFAYPVYSGNLKEVQTECEALCRAVGPFPAAQPPAGWVDHIEKTI